MKDIEDLESQATISEQIKDMTQNNPGWKHVNRLIKEMRDEAFKTWSDMPLDAKPEEIMSVRAKEKILGELIQRLTSLVNQGDEARTRLQEMERDNKRDQEAMISIATQDKEIESLGKPLTLLEKVFGR